MPYALYVCLQDDNKIAAFAMDPENGQLSSQAEVPLAGGPSVMALSPDQQKVYVGTRSEPAISTYQIDQGTGRLTLQGSASTKHAPTFLAPDRTGKYLLSAYYQGGSVAVHPIEADGSIGTQPIDQHETAVGAHAVSTDPSNRFAFAPHIARIQDNVLEPPRDNPGPNVILQFRFDAKTGRLSPNSSFKMAEEAGRDPASLSVTLGGAPEDLAVLRRNRDLGVTRMTVRLPPAGKDQILPILDRWAKLIPQVNS